MPLFPPPPPPPPCRRMSLLFLSPLLSSFVCDLYYFFPSAVTENASLSSCCKLLLQFMLNTLHQCGDNYLPVFKFIHSLCCGGGETFLSPDELATLLRYCTTESTETVSESMLLYTYMYMYTVRSGIPCVLPILNKLLVQFCIQVCGSLSHGLCVCKDIRMWGSGGEGGRGRDHFPSEVTCVIYM